MEFENLFTPIKIGRVEVKNRVCMAPMGTEGLVDKDGLPTQRLIDYFVERAKGEVGLIITNLFKVENEIEKHKIATPIITYHAMPLLTELIEAVHSYGSTILFQLTAGFGRVAHPSILDCKPVSASALPNFWCPEITCRELTTDEVERLVEAFGDAAELLAEAGADGVELHGHEGYLLDQFTTSIWNRRTDKYGGNLRDRLRFPIEVMREIKKRAGNNFIVQYRFSLKHYLKDFDKGALPGEEFEEKGRDIEEGMEMAKLLEEAGFDSLHVDAGCYGSWYWAHPPIYQEAGCMLGMAEKAKSVVGIPVIGVGKLDNPEIAEKAIREGKADLIALGRGLLADPYWALKVKEGRLREIRPCIGCHECLERIITNRPLSCAVNPTCGRERLLKIEKANDRKRVVVIGGGVAGMEASRVLALRGYDVTLFEKEELGGNLIPASCPDFKRDLRRLLEWYRYQMEVLGIRVEKRKVEGEDIVKLNPDVVIVATGSSPVVPDIPGVNRPEVITSVDLLRGVKQAGDKVVVIGGGLVGCEVAIWLAKRGKDVTIIEILPKLLSGEVSEVNRMMLLDMLSFYNVKIKVNSEVLEIGDGEVHVINKGSGERSKIEFDTVVLACGFKPNREVYDLLANKVKRIYLIGDSKRPRRVKDAVWEAFQIAISI